MFSAVQQWLSSFFTPTTPALCRMRLGPDHNPDNPLMLQFFTWNATHPTLSWWKHFEAEIPELARMGFTQVWLPPPNKAAEKNGRGYDAYDLWDLGEFERKGVVRTRWGTRQELLEACQLAHQHGVDILIDAVLNHKLGADRVETFPAVPVDPQNRTKTVGKVRNIEGWTQYDYPSRNGKYSEFRWNQTHFTGIDWDNSQQERAVYRITGKGHQGWSKNVDKELGNYDYLLGADIDHRRPDVQEDLFNWGNWILETTGASGFRLDAIKHIDRNFLRRFIQKTREQCKVPMFSVSEYWSGDIKALLPYVKAFGGDTAFFDVPLHMNFCQASKRGAKYDLRKIFDKTLVAIKPSDAVLFVDNHDTVWLKIANIAKVEGQSLESWVESNFKLQAYAIILLRGHGHPCVFYGDLYPNEECYSDVTAKGLRRLVEARKLFAYGPTFDYFEERNCIGFVRMGDAQHSGCVVLVSNQDTSECHSLRMNVGQMNAGATYLSFMEKHGIVHIDADGWGIFSCFANHVQVWVKG